jgi:S-formylglutathione hydrolase FrmB
MESDATDETTPGQVTLPLQTGRYFSQALGREQPYAYLLPAETESLPTQERRYPLLVLLHGRDGGYQDWAANTRIARYAAAYSLCIAFPDGGNGWYTNAADGSARYEDDLIQDFLPHLQATLPVLPPGKHWGIGGLSMGGYGAIKLALKHPELFSLAVSHSGALEKWRVPEPHPVFGDPVRDAAFRLRESPFRLAEQAMSRWPTERPRLYLDCGESDELIAANRRFHGHLTFIGYLHTYREMPGYHTWPYWNRAFRAALPEITQQLGVSPHPSPAAGAV